MRANKTNRKNRRASSRNSIRPSHDGHQFHYLWAARRCLRLLLPQDDLIKISIEGPSPCEHANASSISVGEEIIDVAEYFGDEEEQKPKQVRYIQLKHSTLRANTHWTASGLEPTIRAFAELYKDSCSNSSKRSPKIKEFCFVTNRQISTRFMAAIEGAVTETEQRYPREIEKIEHFSGLTGNSLVSFLKLLRFDEREGNYLEQLKILFQETSNYIPITDTYAPQELKDLVIHKASSAGRSNPEITKTDVLTALKTTEEKFFPAPRRIKNLGKKTISFSQETEFISKIVESDSPIVIHADAGVGKTIFATRIQSSLPNDSECILYDCFGDGSYRNLSTHRHRHQEAFVQIANELAAKGLCYPLVPTFHADAQSYMQEFSHRIEQASKSIRLKNPKALICIVVDAADNAQMISEDIGEKRSFVKDLIREKGMPENVRLVFICRTHRQGYLDQPFEAISLELSPFDCERTGKHLRQKFKNADKHDIEEFHRLSSGNPRVQAFALSRSKTLDEALSSLGPNPTTVADIIKKLLDEAIKKMKSESTEVERTEIDKICKGLAFLRPEIPISVLSEISGVEKGAIRSFVTNLDYSLRQSDNTIRFSDEPAETWFRKNIILTSDEMNRFIKILLPLAETSAYSVYVASILPELMQKAKKIPELEELALASKGLPEDSVAKHDIELQRLQFALKATLGSKNYLASTKLALKAGGEMAGKSRLDAIVQENTDIVAKFSNINNIWETIHQRTFKSNWAGARYVYEAALLSDSQESVSYARNRLRSAEKYLKSWNDSPKEKREKIRCQDIVAFIIACINIYGPEKGACDLGSWQSNKISLEVGRIVTRRLIEHNRIQDVEEFSRAAKSENNLHLVIAIASELQELQLLPPKDVTQYAFRLIKNSLSKAKDSQEFNLADIAPLVEASLKHGVCTHAKAVDVISYYLPSHFPTNISPHFPEEWALMLKYYCLRAALQERELELRELVSPELQNEIDGERHSMSSKTREFRENVGVLLPWCQLWASAFLGYVTKETLSDEIQRARKITNSIIASYYPSDSHIMDKIALLWFDALYRLSATNADTLGVFSDWKDKLPRPLFVPTLISIARLCSKSNATEELALQYSQEVFDLIKDEGMNAEHKSECFIDSARAIVSVSPSEAKRYFEQAVDVASKVGDENIPRWSSILNLADQASTIDRPLPKTSYRLARCAELTYYYGNDNFDWKGTIGSLCNLCPSSSLAVISRWRDRDFGWSEEILPITINRLIEKGQLNAQDALPLIAFGTQWDYDQLLENVLSTLATRDEKRAVTAHLYRYMQFRGGDFQKLQELVSRHGIEIEDLDERIHFEEEKKSNNNKKIDEEDYMAVETAPDWNIVFSERDLTTAKGISQAYSEFSKTKFPWQYRKEFFKEAMEQIRGRHKEDFIKAVSEVPEFSRYVLNDFLEQAFEAWGNRSYIKEKLQMLFKDSCRRFCMDIIEGMRYKEDLNLFLKDAYVLTEINEDEIIDIIVDAIREKIDFIDSNRLFSLAGLLARKLSKDEALDALECGLDFFNDILQDRHGDGEWSDDLNPPSDIKESLAGYIWASMAAPDSVMRWEGVHVILGLAALERKEVIKYVFEFADKGVGGPFVDARLPFYDLHALQWLLIGLARSTEFPEILAPFANQIIGWALNEQPHVLIRQFAARTALALINKGMMTDEYKSDIENINVSRLPRVESKEYGGIDEESTDFADDRTFYFGIDIGPYWYGPLGRVFALSQKRIEYEALKIIRERFAAQGKGERMEDERHKKKIYRENHTFHSYSSYPRADDLNFYYSYHAMMIVAGNLLVGTQVHHDPESGKENEFTDWLHGYDLSRTDGRWLWDRRDPSPMKRHVWQDKKDDNETLPPITKDNFEEVFCDANMLNIWGTWTVANGSYEQSIHIRSALVSPDKSLALLRTLGELDSYSYVIPNVSMNQEIDEFGFQLKGWIVVEDNRQELDHLDRWAGGINFPPPMPARHIVDRMGLTTDLDCRFWKDQKDCMVMKSKVWGHFEERDPRGFNVSSPEQGNRLQASMSFLKSMLKQLNCDLIIDVEIGFRKPYKPWSIKHDKEESSRKNKLYLLKTNGQLCTL